MFLRTDVRKQLIEGMALGGVEEYSRQSRSYTIFQPCGKAATCEESVLTGERPAECGGSTGIRSARAHGTPLIIAILSGSAEQVHSMEKGRVRHTQLIEHGTTIDT